MRSDEADVRVFDDVAGTYALLGVLIAHCSVRW